MTDGNLTKAALIQEVVHAAGLTKQRAEIIVESLFGSIAEALRQGEKVELRGFGSFRLRHRGPHSARNPRTGARVDVPSKRVAYFKPGKELKELINRELARARTADVILSRGVGAGGPADRRADRVVQIRADLPE